MTQPSDFDAAGYVRQASRRTRMNQREFAATRAVSASTVSRTEAGRTPITLASDRSPFGKRQVAPRRAPGHPSAGTGAPIGEHPVTPADLRPTNVEDRVRHRDDRTRGSGRPALD